MKPIAKAPSKKIKQNYTYNLFYQIVTYTVPLFTTPYLSRVLGPEGIGTISFSESVVAYFVLLCNLGIGTYGQREISYVQDDLSARSIVFWETKFLNIVTCFISLIIYGWIIRGLNNKIIYIILSINIIAALTDVTWFYRGLEEFGKTVVCSIAIKLINVIFIFLFIKTENDLIYYILGHSVFQLIGNMSLWFYLPKYIKIIPLKELSPLKILPVAFSLFIPEIAITIYTVLDKTMIGIIANDYNQNGYYEQAMKITKMLMAMITSLGTVIAPRIGAFYGKGNVQEAKNLIYKNYEFVLEMGIPLSVGLYYIAPSFVIWFLGDKFAQTGLLLRILTWLIIIISISNVTGMQFLIPSKRQNVLTITVVLGALVNFLLNCILIKRYESVGAAIASLIAEFVVLIAQFVFVRNEIYIERIIKIGLPYFVAGFFMAICLRLVDGIMAYGFMGIIIAAIIGMIAYLFGLLFIHKLVCKNDY